MSGITGPRGPSIGKIGFLEQSMRLKISQADVLALAILEIRHLLAGELGVSVNTEVPPHIRHAAHLAYAIHNEALTVLSGGDFDPESALAHLTCTNSMFGEDGYTAELLNECRGQAET